MADCLKRLTRVAAVDRVEGEQADVSSNRTELSHQQDGPPPVTVIVAIHQPNYEVSCPSQNNSCAQSVLASGCRLITVPSLACSVVLYSCFPCSTTWC